MNHTIELRLATRRNGRRDGELMLVSPDAKRWLSAVPVAPTLQYLLDHWDTLSVALDARYRELCSQHWSGAEDFDIHQCMAPLPRAYQWADASVYRNHARLIYQWRKEPIPPGYEEVPLVYQGGSDVMLGPTQDIEAVDEAHDIDLEAEIAVIVKDLPIGTSAEQAQQGIALVCLLNDVSLRGLIPKELAKGFGFYQSKPATSFAPIVVTPGALGSAWKDCMLDASVRIDINSQRFGEPRANAEVVFDFAQILVHLTRTRTLSAGSIVGAGTISNEAESAGSACITEARVRQILKGVTEDQLHPYLKHGDRVRIEALNDDGQTLFGAIDQQVRLV